VTTNPAAGLPFLNLAEATFDCTYGRGCDGICCREGRPPVDDDDVRRIEGRLQAVLPLLRPRARAAVERRGYLTRRRRHGRPTLRVAAGWCVFFNQGCVLHRIGAAEGDAFRYKPSLCALFPVQADPLDRWFVRQKGFNAEQWDLPCLDPATSARPAAESLVAEIALARRYTAEAAALARVARPERSEPAGPADRQMSGE
jgi:hypothetical protein